jgi:hypothetical protein
VPFGKWAHLAYRPLAIYFSRVQVLAEETASAKAQNAAAEAAS